MWYNIAVKGVIFLLRVQAEYRRNFILRTTASVIFVLLGIYSFTLTTHYVNNLVTDGILFYNLVMLVGELSIVLGVIHILKQRIDYNRNAIVTEVLYWISLFFTTIAIAILALFAVHGFESYVDLFLRSDIIAIFLRVMLHVLVLYTSIVINGLILILYFELLYPILKHVRSRVTATFIVFVIITVFYILYGYEAREYINSTLVNKYLFINSYTGLIISINYISKYVYDHIYRCDVAPDETVISEVNNSFYIILFMPFKLIGNKPLKLVVKNYKLANEL